MERTWTRSNFHARDSAIVSQHFHGHRAQLDISNSTASPIYAAGDVEMFSEEFSISKLAIPAVSILIAFLAYTSQYFFLHFESVPLTTEETWKINIFALCIWICYYRTCFVDPGRLPKTEERPKLKGQESDEVTGRQRWCRKCDAYKPPRAHHCRTCKR